MSIAVMACHALSWRRACAGMLKRVGFDARLRAEPRRYDGRRRLRQWTDLLRELRNAAFRTGRPALDRKTLLSVGIGIVARGRRAKLPSTSK